MVDRYESRIHWVGDAPVLTHPQRPDGAFVRYSAYAKLEQENKRLRDALEEIEKFGHSYGHGRGYTCANKAKQALGSC